MEAMDSLGESSTPTMVTAKPIAPMHKPTRMTHARLSACGGDVAGAGPTSVCQGNFSQPGGG
jgi:hypothetical protein